MCRRVLSGPVSQMNVPLPQALPSCANRTRHTGRLGSSCSMPPLSPSATRSGRTPEGQTELSRKAGKEDLGSMRSSGFQRSERKIGWIGQRRGKKPAVAVRPARVPTWPGNYGRCLFLPNRRVLVRTTYQILTCRKRGDCGISD